MFVCSGLWVDGVGPVCLRNSWTDARGRERGMDENQGDEDVLRMTVGEDIGPLKSDSLDH